MKPAFRTITYIIYPKDYVPGMDKYYYTNTFKKAKKLAINLGYGSEVVRNIEICNKRKHILGDWLEIFTYKKRNKND